MFPTLASARRAPVRAGGVGRRRWRSSLVVAVGLALALALLPSSPASAAAPTATFTATLSDTNLVTLAWTVSGGDSSNLLYVYEDIGFRPQDCIDGPTTGCQTTVRVRAGGVYRYTLSVKSNAGEYTNITRELVVPPLAKPTVPAARVHVDLFNKTAQTLSWTAAGPTNDRAHHYVTVTRAGTIFPIGVVIETGMPTDAAKFPLTGSYTVPASELPALGEHTYSVASCRQPDLTKLPICSASTTVTWVVEPAQFTPGGRRLVPANQALALAWSTSGNMWFVSAPSLGIGQWTTTPSLTIPAAQVVAGVHDVTLSSCVYGGACSNRSDVKATKAGTIHQELAYGGTVFLDPKVATLTPDDGTGPVALQATAGGTYYHQAAEGAHVNAGDVVGYVLTGNVGKVQLVVGGGPSVPNLTSRTIAQDFTVQNVDTSARGALGQGLDVTFDSTGDVWSLGEFSTAVGRIQGTTLSQFDSPSGRVWNPDSGLFERSKPFASMFGAGMAASTGLAERVIDTGSAVYVAQGGGSAAPNYSRLLRISRTTADNPATPDDDRICALHLPGNDQQVIGLAYDPATNRVWYAEQANSGKPPGVSWFVDGELGCNNDLQYQLRQQQTQPNGTTSWVEVPNAAAIATADAAKRCPSATATHCIHRIDLPTAAGAPGPIAVDPAGGFLWVVDYHGSSLSRVPLNGATTASVKVFPLPTPVLGSFFLGFPWQIRVDANAVYLVEYRDNQLVRFDKTANAETCSHLSNGTTGTNPCIKELFLPMAGNSVRGHSLALRNGKLWFTVTNESRATDAGVDGAYFGYIDTASWAGSASPTGRIYNNLSSLGAPPGSDHRSIRGIDVSATGKVATTDLAGSVLVFTPK